ncbi:Uncharacterized protein Rs2_25572 [Raphanus sativus]|nr:Uncharacterized protein Rs2_25572 [Raphanus sativus]
MLFSPNEPASPPLADHSSSLTLQRPNYNRRDSSQPRFKLFESCLSNFASIMSHLYHKREDKAKWVATTSSSTRRRPPVKIPPCDNADLIEANKLTLIGRVTNPGIQKPIGLIDWLIQYWNMEPPGRVTGRDLGPELFYPPEMGACYL